METCLTNNIFFHKPFWLACMLLSTVYGPLLHRKKNTFPIIASYIIYLSPDGALEFFSGTLFIAYTLAMIH